MTAQRSVFPQPTRGFGLIELMIGILLGSILLLGLAVVFSASRTAYNTAQGSAEVQENGRFALDFLQRDARMVGHMGCVSDEARFLDPHPEFFSHFVVEPAPPALQVFTAAPFSERFDVSVQGYEASGSGPGVALVLPVGGAWSGGAPASNALPAGFPGAMPAPLAGSDILFLRFFGTDSAPVTAINTAAGTITAPAFAAQATAQPAGMYAIANCKNASVFEATGVGGGGVIAAAVGAQNLSGFSSLNGELYNPFAPEELTVYRGESMAYYVANGAAGTPSLFRVKYTSNPAAPVAEEIVEGIDNMQILYGRDTAGGTPDGAIDQYDTALTINGLAADPSPFWRQVGSIRVALLARSIARGNVNANVAGSPTGCTALPNCYSMLGLNVTPPIDSNYREVYVSTIALRNRLFGN